MPRVFELLDLIEHPLAPSAYFPDFETGRDPRDRFRRAAWLAREREFQRLDAESWKALKSEARAYLTRHDPNGRGWQQLIDVLNQARAHNYLVELGCSGVRFVPRGTKETPDLEGTLDTRKVLCEVKTINISEQEANRRNSGQGGYISNSLNDQFLKKLFRCGGDMLGGVWEWVSDWYGEFYYKISPLKNPKGPSNILSWHVIRGGSWIDDKQFVRTTIRYPGLADNTDDFWVGFRCARDLN